MAIAFLSPHANMSINALRLKPLRHLKTGVLSTFHAALRQASAHLLLPVLQHKRAQRMDLSSHLKIIVLQNSLAAWEINA